MICCVCRLEGKWYKEKLKDAFGKSSDIQSEIVHCDDNSIIADGIPVLHGRETLQIDEFAGQSCYEIVHSYECKVSRNTTRST